MGKKTNLIVTLTDYSVCLWRFTKNNLKQPFYLTINLKKL